MALISSKPHAGCWSALSAARTGGFIASAVAVAMTSPALAALLNWNNASGGSAALSSNWTPSAIPAAADDLTFNVGGFYTITFNATVGSADTHLYRDGSITLSLLSPHTVASGITIADLAADSAGVTLTTGTLQCNGPIVIGDAASSFGTLSINDDDADLITTTSLGDLTMGNNGSGSLSITGGGLLTVADHFVAGANSTSTVSVTVSGVASASARSELHVNGGQDTQIGAGGDATMSVNTGALADFAADLVIANGSASTSSLTVGGLGLSYDAHVIVDGDLRVGANLTGAAAGNGTLTINSDGVVDVGGSTSIGGDPQGGSGALSVNGTGGLHTHGLTIGAGGSLTFTDGTIRVTGGTFVPPAALPLVLNGAGFAIDPDPTLILEGGATCTLPGALFVGTTNGGEMQINGAGTTVNCNPGSGITIGHLAGGDGTVTVNGGLVTGTSNTLTAGSAGMGSLNLPSGTVQVTSCLIGALPSGNGTVSVTGSGLLDLSGNLFVGGNGVAEQGSGSMTIAGGGEVDVGGGTTVWGTGFLFLSSGDLNITSSLTLHGNAAMYDSTIAANQVDLANGDLDGFGTVNARVNVTSAASAISAVGGALTLGNAAAADGFVNVGTLNVGSQPVALSDSDGAVLGNVTIAGGILTFPDGSSLASTRTFSGTGTIHGDFTNSGTINPSGIDGLTFTGAVSGVGLGISGTRINLTIGPGSYGSLSGTGTVDAEIAGTLPPSSITATGPLTLGKATSASGVNFLGQLLVGPHAVTLHDLDSAVVGNVSINGGSLTAANGVTISTSHILMGDGVVHGDLVVNGSVAPGFSSSIGGRLDVDGTCTFGPNPANFGVNINGAGTANFDRLIISGAATLDGRLTVIVPPGFTPFVGQTFTILSAASRSGTFSQVVAPGLATCRDVSINYTPTGVQVVFVAASCPGDVAPAAGNGVVNVDDLLAVIIGWGSCPAPPALCVADTNCSGTVNVDDLLAVITTWGTCP